jgi:hypothetical protein
MAHQVLTDCKLWIDGYDFSGDFNALGLDYSVDAVPDDAFGVGTHIFLGGLHDVEGNHQGAVNLGTDGVEDILFANVGVVDVPVTLSPDSGADGEVAHFLKALSASYSPGAEIGQLKRFSVRFKASGERLVRGTIMHNATRTASGQGTARQLGAVSATQKLYAALHVIAASDSDTLDVIVRSDDNGGMTSPTTRVTFAQATAVGSEFATPVDGAITDDYWQVDFTIGGSSPSFEFVVVVGIL